MFQAVFSVLLAALSGPGLIAPDLANNALPLYFSRPLTRVDYVAARMAAAGRTALAGHLGARYAAVLDASRHGRLGLVGRGTGISPAASSSDS